MGRARPGEPFGRASPQAKGSQREGGGKRQKQPREMAQIICERPPGEFAEEDRGLAEEGMVDYSEHLMREDAE